MTAVDIVPINDKHRFSRDRRGLWSLQRHRPDARRPDRSPWTSIANDRSIIRLGNYCDRIGVFPNIEHTEALVAACRAEFGPVQGPPAADVDVYGPQLPQENGDG